MATAGRHSSQRKHAVDMDVSFNSKQLLEDPAFTAPVRLGVFIHLAAFARPDDSYVFKLRPSDLSDRIGATRNQVEDAITKLAEFGVLALDKKADKRGVWTIDLSPASRFLIGNWGMEVPKTAPVSALMKQWDYLYRERTGTPQMRRKGDFWREKSDWITLWDSMGEPIYDSMNLYFSNSKYAQWGYRFSVFFRVAHELVETHAKGEWRYN